MSIPVIVASVLVLAGLFLGLLSERHRRVPALPLLVLGPVAVVWIAALHGLEIGLLWMAALSALYRAPLVYWLRRGLRHGCRQEAGQVG